MGQGVDNPLTMAYISIVHTQGSFLMTKKEAIAIFERAGFTFIGFNDIGWGEKFYVFENPSTETYTGVAYSTYDLSHLRKKARFLDYNA